MSYTNGLDKPEDYFNTKLYTGNGTSQSITGVGFQPDFTWIKARSGTHGTQNHRLFDAIRGVNKELYSDLSDAEATTSTGLTSLDSDGFSVSTSAGVNGSSTEYASWSWLASNTTASNTDGSITSNVSANTTSGFSIVSYTGTGANATVGHGLGVAPKMIIVKRRDSSANWFVGQDSLGWTKYLYLDLTEASATNSGAWNNTSPTSSVFSLGTFGNVNASGGTYIAYCFAEKKGFSKFGSYTGNGSTDGTFVYTGFKPAFVIIKNASVSQDWYILDNKRDISNVCDSYVTANNSTAEQTYTLVDFLSNGFKARDNGGASNGNGNTMIYMAFASNPFVTSTGIPTTAR